MSDSSTAIKDQIDAINRRRVAIQKQIEARRQSLYALNAQLPDLERRYQAAVAAQQQAQIESQGQTTH